MFDAAVRAAVTQLAQEFHVEPAALMAVAQVESGGQATALVNGAPMPLIRWEGHHFHKLAPPHLRERAVAESLANPNVGGVKNPGTQQARFDLLARAEAIDSEAAISSCSWGVGQVMGSHWKWLGYASVAEFKTRVCSGVDGQIEVMARFIRQAGLIDELQRKDWAGFARAYNGKLYHQQGYHTKMAQAYAQYAAVAVSDKEPDDLRMGAYGPAVADLQIKLKSAGYTIEVDGDFGPATRRAIVRFQQEHGLMADGIVGSHTWAALDRLRGFPAFH